MFSLLDIIVPKMVISVLSFVGRKKEENDGATTTVARAKLNYLILDRKKGSLQHTILPYPKGIQLSSSMPTSYFLIFCHLI